MQRLPSLSFHDRIRAMREIGELSRSLPPAALNRFDLLLATSAAPEEGLRYFARLREQHPAFFQRLTLSTAGLRYLIAVFTHSHFLSEEILEHPEWAEELLDAGDLHRVLEPDELRARLNAMLAPGLPGPVDFAKFRRRQLLRIVVRDVLGLATLPE